MTNPRSLATEPTAPVLADGKRRLIDAALRVCAREGMTLSSLGLRELAREADLNHNTFYRHFSDYEALAQAAAEEIARQIMDGMQQVRRRAQKHSDATRGAVDYFLAFVIERPEPFIVGLRELHSLGSPMRHVLQNVLKNIAQESVDQIIEQDLVPGVAPTTLLQATTLITHHMFERALDVIERPQQRRQVAEQMTRTIRMIFLGCAQAQRA